MPPGILALWLVSLSETKCFIIAKIFFYLRSNAEK